MRNDIHSPKNIITADYEFVTIRSREDDEMGFGGEAVKAFTDHMNHTGGKFSTHEHGGECHVCGAWMIDYAIFYHTPSNSYIKTGCDCAAHIEAGHDAAFKRQAQIRRAASARRKVITDICEVLDNIGILGFIENLYKDEIGGLLNEPDVNPHDDYNSYNYSHMVALRYDYTLILGDFAMEMDHDLFNRTVGKIEVINDIIRGCIKFKKTPSEKQGSYLKRLINDIENVKQIAFERKQEWEAAEEAPVGKHKVTGEVISVQERETAYGYTWKMLVKDDRGFKVWSTVPSKIKELDRGDRIEFTATLERSSDDAKFAFAKRPTKAQKIS